MVDSSLGGKTGVDLPQGKNLVGAFHPPKLVWTDPLTLETLPQAELRSGMAEVLKAGVIADPKLFVLCRQGWDAINANRQEIVRRAMAVKINIIQQDPYERSLRAVLNFGHTIGHAIETVSEYSLRHGEAVAIGMLLEARLSEELGLAQESLSAPIHTTLKHLSLPVRIPPRLDRQAILEIMFFDKKKASGELKFALPVRIGEVQPGVKVPVDLLKKIIQV
jgi:3-dehydroquinate synthetase